MDRPGRWEGVSGWLLAVDLFTSVTRSIAGVRSLTSAPVIIILKPLGWLRSSLAPSIIGERLFASHLLALLHNTGHGSGNDSKNTVSKIQREW